MQRAALILLLFVLLLNGRHPVKRPAPKGEIVTVVATPLDLYPDEPHRRQVGELTYLAGWALDAGNDRFGGISSMTVADDGFVTALSDSGEGILFRPGKLRFRAEIRPVAIMEKEKGAPRAYWDTESMAVDPATGQRWVGFELESRICRYSPGFRRVEQCVWPPEAADWPTRTGMESLARLPDGRFLAIGENTPGALGGHDVLLWAGDPVLPGTPPPALLGYRAPVGYLPTDALAISPTRMLVMNRRFTLADMFTGIITLVDISDLRPGTLLQGRIVARLAAPLPHDNFEALALSHEKGQPILWVASDDNSLFFQRTLLLKFAMPASWFTRGEALR